MTINEESFIVESENTTMFCIKIEDKAYILLVNKSPDFLISNPINDDVSTINYTSCIITDWNVLANKDQDFLKHTLESFEQEEHDTYSVAKA
jgi:hypothetical protein